MIDSRNKRSVNAHSLISFNLNIKETRQLQANFPNFDKMLLQEDKDAVKAQHYLF